MNAAATATLSSHAISVTPGEFAMSRVLALVQDGMVISTFPGSQVEAALDLARVLCRALAHPIEIFRLCGDDAAGLYSGAIVNTRDAGWVPFAQVRPDWLGGVRVDLQRADIVGDVPAVMR